jgi:hypothetical protein
MTHNIPLTLGKHFERNRKYLHVYQYSVSCVIHGQLLTECKERGHITGSTIFALCLFSGCLLTRNLTCMLHNTLFTTPADNLLP